MKLFFICTAFLFSVAFVTAQNKPAYINSIKSYQKNYTTTHEVVRGGNRKFFRFYNADENFKIQCSFERSMDTSVVIMKTSGKTIPEKNFVRYGMLTFTIHDTTLHLTVYQSKAAKYNSLLRDYLFIPFTDITTGDETYGSGRYIDIKASEIQNNTVEIDFNKAYNPYCAYSTGYNCPIPPRENFLAIAIKAGEKTFAKTTVH